jgi:ribonuclease HI
MKIWCDGAYKPSLNQGGIGVIWVDNGKIIKRYSKGFKKTPKIKVTNQTMEMVATFAALRAISKELDSLEIVTDSMYVIGGLTLGWKRKANVELWEKLDKELDRVQNLVKSPITFTHTYGHSDDNFNNLVDSLADSASKEFIE